MLPGIIFKWEWGFSSSSRRYVMTLPGAGLGGQLVIFTNVQLFRQPVYWSIVKMTNDPSRSGIRDLRIESGPLAIFSCSSKLNNPNAVRHLGRFKSDGRGLADISALSPLSSSKYGFETWVLRSTKDPDTIPLVCTCVMLCSGLH